MAEFLQWTALKITIIGVLVAIAITTAMDASGLSNFSALPLFPLLCLLWYWQRLSRWSMGFVWGRFAHLGLAVLYPVLVSGTIFLIASITGSLNLSNTNWEKAMLNFAIMSLTTSLVVIITEEGFFRGWLWASLEKARQSQTTTLIWSSIAFSLWHLSAVSLNTGFDLPVNQIPVYMVNAVLMGAVWGMLRWISGSVIVSSVSHGLWNGIAYIFFGYGTNSGALGIENISIYGIEVGVLGLVVNAIFALTFWRYSAKVRVVQIERR